MKKFFLLIVTCFSLFCSCGKEEKENSDIEWQFDKTYSSKYHFEVPSDGGDYSMECKNYSRVSIGMVQEKDTIITLDQSLPIQSLNREWYNIVVDKSTINVTFLRNNSIQDRSLTINAIAINASDVISFSQKGKKE